jgi:hypothetical protein
MTRSIGLAKAGDWTFDFVYYETRSKLESFTGLGPATMVGFGLGRSVIGMEERD